MLVGSIEREGDNIYNILALLDGGKVAAIRRKHELPNYGTFDEKRVFVPGPLPEPVEFRGVRLGLPICEDGWLPTVCSHLAERGAELLICVNGSPYEIDKDERRHDDGVRGTRARNGAAADFPQPRRRAGRTGVRRMLVRASPPMARSSTG